MKSIVKTHFLLFLVIGLISLLSGCEKSNQGPKGDPGAAGNANVQASTYQATGWTNGSDFWYVDLNVPALTTSNHNSAAVEVFLSTDGGTNWFALPYTAVSTVDYFMGFVTAVEKVQVQWTYNGIGNGSSPNSFFNATCQFKVVVIPPALIKKDVDTKNYDEVKTTYNLGN